MCTYLSRAYFENPDNSNCKNHQNGNKVVFNMVIRIRKIPVSNPLTTFVYLKHMIDLDLPVDKDAWNFLKYYACF